MNVGVGLPGSFAHIGRRQVLDWAQRAEAGPFASLSAGERLAYATNDPLITMAALAAATERIRLMTSVLIAPLHGATLLAKQLATLDVLCDGRLTVGVGSGVPDRTEDFELSDVDFATRGTAFSATMAQVREIWQGHPVHGHVVGPEPMSPGGPEVLFGGWTKAAMRRAASFGDGLITFSVGIDAPAQAAIHQSARASWAEAGRSDTPRWVAGVYFGLGPCAKEDAARFFADYYAHLPSAAVVAMAEMVEVLDHSGVHAALDTFAEAGVDELFFSPTSCDPGQVDMLAEAVATW